MEELKFDKNGRLTTRNAMGYKIPRVTNLPRQFNITLLKESSNPYAVYSAKVYSNIIEEYIFVFIYIYISLQLMKLVVLKQKHTDLLNIR